MKALLLLLFILAGQFLFSQDTASVAMRSFPYPSEAVSINVSPLCLADVYNGSAYRFGAQFRPLKRMAIGGEGGGYIEPFTRTFTPFFHIKGYHYRARLAYFPKKYRAWSFGVEYQFKHQEFSYSDSTETEPAFEANVSKKVYGYNVFAAYDHRFTRRLFLDIQLGLGLRYREIFNTRSDVVGNTSTTFPWDSMNTGRVTTGQNYLPNVTLAVRLCYVLIR